MRIGRPVKAFPQPLCDYCGEKALFARPSDDAYPYRDDHGPVWICVSCQAWIGARKNHEPLGRLADAALREAKSRLHDSVEPLVAGKVRRDSVSVFEARAKAIRWVASELKIDPAPSSIHAMTLEQCEAAIQHVEAYLVHSRKPA